MEDNPKTQNRYMEERMMLASLFMQLIVFIYTVPLRMARGVKE